MSNSYTQERHDSRSHGAWMASETPDVFTPEQSGAVDSCETPNTRDASMWSQGFGWLLGGQTISAVGSQITFVALPIIAVATLNANPAQMGVLTALDNLPYLMVGLFVGTWVDRHRRRRLMIASDLLRAAAVVTIPIAYLTGHVTFIQLCIVMFIGGLGNILFDVASQAHMPDIVPADHLVTANGTLQTAAGLSAIAAPGLVSMLMGMIGAPLTVLIDVASYGVSAGTIHAMPGKEEKRAPAEESSREMIRAGIETLRADRRLTAILGAVTTVSFAMNLVMAVLVYYVLNVRGFDATTVGWIFVAFGVGGAAGAFTGQRLESAFGARKVLTVGPLVGGLGMLGVVLSEHLSVLSAFFLLASVALSRAGIMAQQVIAAGLRQSLAPESVRGRVLGTMRFVEWGVMPLGAFAGGALGSVFGAAPTLLIGAAFVAAAALWVAGPVTFDRQSTHTNQPVNSTRQSSLK